MDIRPIKTRTDYKAALGEIESGVFALEMATAPGRQEGWLFPIGR